MKTEDFERLKAICEKEGFEISIANRSLKDVFEIHKKDPWEGVEFVEYEDIHFSGGQRYFKINWIDSEEGLIHVNSGYLSKSKCKPSTEQAYVEQLKKEAFERFGEIKKGDRFDSADGYRVGIEFNGFANDIQYSKEIDALFIGGLRLYRQGKWAERVKERVEVYIESYEAESKKPYPEWSPNATFRFISQQEIKLDGNVGQFLASQLEKYLNGEIE